MNVFASSGNARTFDFQAGDVGYVPKAMGHYIENTGRTPVRFLEISRNDRYQDATTGIRTCRWPSGWASSRASWCASTCPSACAYLRALPKKKPVVS